MNFSVLSPKEIRWRYEQADDKGEILQVLADLTASEPRDVAELLNVPCVYSRRSERGRPCEFDQEEARRLYDMEWTDARIANKLNVSRETIGRWRRVNGLAGYAPRALDTVKAMELYKQGKRDPEIAQMCGVSKSTVWTWRTKLGLPAVDTPIKTDWRKLPV